MSEAALSTSHARPPILTRRRAVLGLGALGLTAAFAYFGHDYWTVGRFMRSTNDAYVGGDVTIVAPKVAGFIDKVAVEDNQVVHAGDLLVKLDDRDYRAALARTDATVAAQHATLANLEATRKLQQAVIAQAQASIAAATAELTRTRADQTRYQSLAQTAAIPVQRLEQAEAAYNEAVAVSDRAHAQLTAAQQQLEVIASQKAQAQAALQGAEAERDVATLNLGYTELRSPIDGVVGNRSARPGALAPIGAQLLAVVPSRGLWVDANFKESQLARIRPGLHATVVADVFPDETFHGRVLSVAPATGAQFSVLPPENATGNFTKIVQRVPVRIQLEGEGASLGRLRPGLSVTAEVDERE